MHTGFNLYANEEQCLRLLSEVGSFRQSQNESVKTAAEKQAQAQAHKDALDIEIRQRAQGVTPQVSLHQEPVKWWQSLAAFGENNHIANVLRKRAEREALNISNFQATIDAVTAYNAALDAAPELVNGVIPEFQKLQLHYLDNASGGKQSLELARAFHEFYGMPTKANGVTLVNQLRNSLNAKYSRQSARVQLSEIVKTELDPYMNAFLTKKKLSARESLPVEIQTYLDGDRSEPPRTSEYSPDMDIMDLFISPAYWWYPGNIYHSLMLPEQVEFEQSRHPMVLNEMIEPPVEIRDQLEIQSSEIRESFETLGVETGEAFSEPESNPVQTSSSGSEITMIDERPDYESESLTDSNESLLDSNTRDSESSTSGNDTFSESLLDSSQESEIDNSPSESYSNDSYSDNASSNDTYSNDSYSNDSYSNDSFSSDSGSSDSFSSSE